MPPSPGCRRAPIRGVAVGVGVVLILLVLVVAALAFFAYQQNQRARTQPAAPTKTPLLQPSQQPAPASPPAKLERSAGGGSPSVLFPRTAGRLRPPRAATPTRKWRGPRTDAADRSFGLRCERARVSVRFEISFACCAQLQESMSPPPDARGWFLVPHKEEPIRYEDLPGPPPGQSAEAYYQTHWIPEVRMPQLIEDLEFVQDMHCDTDIVGDIQGYEFHSRWEALKYDHENQFEGLYNRVRGSQTPSLANARMFELTMPERANGSPRRFLELWLDSEHPIEDSVFFSNANFIGSGADAGSGVSRTCGFFAQLACATRTSTRETSTATVRPKGSRTTGTL